jgi:hypothetical protein
MFSFQVRITHELHERLLAVSVGESRQLKTIATRALEREAEAYESSQKKAVSKKKTKAA